MLPCLSGIYICSSLLIVALQNPWNVVLLVES
jgi:hypothetical protein